jgi:putative acetyltransferase
MQIEIMDEVPADVAAIESATIAAFLGAPHSNGREQCIVRALRDSGSLAISLVADAGGSVVGHVAVSPVSMSTGVEGWFGLGPISVLPHYQRRGVGSRLMLEVLRRLCERGAAGCVLLGDPAFYGRFGFEAAPELLLPGVPPRYFQSITFGPSRPRGIVSYDTAFDAPAEPEGPAPS